jgi:hypothetical protein
LDQSLFEGGEREVEMLAGVWGAGGLGVGGASDIVAAVWFERLIFQLTRSEQELWWGLVV